MAAVIEFMGGVIVPVPDATGAEGEITQANDGGAKAKTPTKKK